MIIFTESVIKYNTKSAVPPKKDKAKITRGINRIFTINAGILVCFPLYHGLKKLRKLFI